MTTRILPYVVAWALVLLLWLLGGCSNSSREYGTRPAAPIPSGAVLCREAGRMC